MTLSSTSTRTAASAICWLALTGAAVLFSTELYANRHGLIDDAYITFRYARNLAQGEGLVFNPGGSRQRASPVSCGSS